MSFRLPFDKIVEIISESSHKSKDDVLDAIKEKKKQLPFPITDEGVAHLLARDWNIDILSIYSKDLKIRDLVDGLNGVSIKAKVIKKYETRNFVRNGGEEGKLVSYLVGDETGVARLLLWNDLVDKFESQIQEGNTYLFKEVRIRDNRSFIEIHLTSASKVEPINEEISIVSKQLSNYSFSVISDLQKYSFSQIYAIVVQVFDPSYFEVCPECNRKVEKREDGYYCATHGKVEPKKSYVFNMVVDDGTDVIRVVVFHDLVDKVLSQLNDSLEDFEKVRSDLLGRWIKIEGKVVYNEMFDRLEMIANNVFVNLNPDDEIKFLERYREENLKSA